MKALAAAAVLASVLAASRLASRPFSREVYLMGTRATLTTWHVDRARGIERLERLLRPIEDAEALLSTWRPESEVSRLNASAGEGPVPLSPPLCAQFVAIDDLVRATHGTFDPAIGALIQAWDIHGEGRLPSDTERARALRRSGWRRTTFDRHACTLALPSGVSIDVGAFGKGEAIDRAREALPEPDAPWLIDLGGQIGAQGAPPGASGWTVSIARPQQRSTPALRLEIRSGSLATSAGSERDLQVNGTRVSHILDPRTGRPAPFTGSVSVWHESGLVADALSTALYVMGWEEGLRWANARDIAVCYLLANGATDLVRPSRAFGRQFGLSVP